MLPDTSLQMDVTFVDGGRLARREFKKVRFEVRPLRGRRRRFVFRLADLGVAEEGRDSRVPELGPSDSTASVGTGFHDDGALASSADVADDDDRLEVLCDGAKRD